MQQGFNIWLPSSVGKVAGALEPGFLLSKTELKWASVGRIKGSDGKPGAQNLASPPRCPDCLDHVGF